MAFPLLEYSQHAQAGVDGRSWVPMAPENEKSVFWNARAPADGTQAARCNDKGLRHVPAAALRSGYTICPGGQAGELFPEHRRPRQAELPQHRDECGETLGTISLEVERRVVEEAFAGGEADMAVAHVALDDLG